MYSYIKIQVSKYIWQEEHNACISNNSINLSNADCCKLKDVDNGDNINERWRKDEWNLVQIQSQQL